MARYTDDVPRYVIDLRANAYHRWKEVIDADASVVGDLAREAAEDYEDVPSFVRLVISTGFGLVYRSLGGLYWGEMRAWADGISLRAGELALLNCSYELSHMFPLENVIGCTSGVRWIPGKGMVHVRSLDWPLRNIGRATRIFEFRSGRRRFVAVGISGFTGVLSGMVPGVYSASINWAPENGLPTHNFGPAFLLREVLSECDTYGEAVYALKHSPLSTPAFFTVCGTEKGQACVVERTQDDYSVRKMNINKTHTLTHANHHVCKRFVVNNTDKELLECSQERMSTLDKSLKAAKGSLVDIASSLDEGIVCNEDSYQQMIFQPKTGNLKVWRWV